MGPQISIYNSSNNKIELWNIGTLQSQQSSKILTVYVWNNKGNRESDVSDLKNAYVTVVDANGETAEDEVAKNKWVHVNIPTIDGDETTFSPIGGSIIRNIKGGINSEENTIFGTKCNSDMDKTYSLENPRVCKLSFCICPPPNSTPGEKLFKIRICGWYT